MIYLKFVLSLLLLLSCTTSAFSQQEMRIAVLNFENRSSSGGNKYSLKAADLMMTELAKGGAFTVIERQRLDAVMREQDFQNSGNVDPQTAVRIGKMLGVDAIVLGTIEKLGTGKQTTRVGDSTITNYNSQVEVNIRAVSVQTGAILFSDSEEASAASKSASVPGFDMGTNAPSVDGPLKTSIQKLARKMTDAIKKTGRPAKKQPAVL